MLLVQLYIYLCTYYLYYKSCAVYMCMSLLLYDQCSPLTSNLNICNVHVTCTCIVYEYGKITNGQSLLNLSIHVVLINISS